MEQLDYFLTLLIGFGMGFCFMFFMAINCPQKQKSVQTVSQIEKTEFYTDQGLRIECKECKVSIGDTIYLMPKNY